MEVRVTIIPIFNPSKYFSSPENNLIFLIEYKSPKNKKIIFK
jgi:hypothetical protein